MSLIFDGETVRALIAERNGPAVTRGLGKAPADADHDYFCRRLANGLEAAEDGECWLYLVSGSECDRGAIYATNGTENVARIAYRIAKGEIPDGKFILHSCDVPACINPEHLRAGTGSENSKDISERGPLWRQVEGYVNALAIAKRLNIPAREFLDRMKSGEIPSVRIGCKGLWVPKSWVRTQPPIPGYYL